MKFEQIIPGTPRNAGDYRFVWIFAFALAFVAAPIVVYFKDAAPWAIAVPIVLGTIVIVIYESKAAFGTRADLEFLVNIPPGFTGLKSYEHLLSLEIHPKKKVPKEQLSLPGFPGFTEATAGNSVRILRDESGREIAVVSCDRFSALLVTYLLENMDKATEKSLRAGLARFGKLGKEGSDIQIFVHDKGIREAIKADFRGNLVTLVSKGGEKVIKDILKALENQRAEEKEKDTVVGD